MIVYLVSNIPIATLREKYSNDPPADFLLEDLIELGQRHDTYFINDLNVAMDKLKSKRSKFVYQIEVKEIEL